MLADHAHHPRLVAGNAVRAEKKAMSLTACECTRPDPMLMNSYLNRDG
jgi:hypothetical protein